MVGSFPSGASPYGVMDLIGNVAEWVNDWYGHDYYDSSPYRNPPGPSSGPGKVRRGGAWGDYLYELYSRPGSFPVSSNPIGFRCAKNAD